MGILKDHIDAQRPPGLYIRVPAYVNLIGLGNKRDKATGNFRVWRKNCKVNMKWIDNNPDKVIGSVDVMPSHEGQAIIFVGMSPIIKKTWKHLKNLGERFVIVATNSSAKYLLDRGIKPHYVVALDGNPGSWTLKLGRRAKDIVGLFSINADPNAFKDWPGKIMVIPYTIGGKKLNEEITRRFGERLPGGGNAINGAVAVFIYRTQSQIFLFVGNELSFKKQYYADRQCRHDQEVKFYATDVKGRKVKTLFPLYEYKVWLEHLASILSPDYWFCNCSEGIFGVDTDNTHFPFIGQLSLTEAVKEVHYALDFEKLPFIERARILYEESYKSGLYTPVGSMNYWESIRNERLQFKKALDVGCGIGQGIHDMRELGYEVFGIDLADNREIWDSIGIAEYCQQAPAHQIPYPDDTFDFIVSTEVMEHIEESYVDDSLKEINRVGSDFFLFTIALQGSYSLMANVVEGHITIKTQEWWLQKIREAGFQKIRYSQICSHSKEDEKYKSLLVTCQKCQESNVRP